MDEKLNYYTNYRSKKYYPGSIHFNGGDENDKIEILGKAEYNNESKHYFVIRFLNSGYMKRINSSQLAHKIDDPCQPTVYGRGIVGVGKHRTNSNGKQTKEGVLWYNMLMRCYSESYLEKTPTYRGCEVCERWLNFQLFCEDLPKLTNYEHWCEDTFKWNLDKDCLVEDNKIYSPETCMFLTSSFNTTISNKATRKYKAISPTGEEIVFQNMRIFAEEHGMTKEGISSVISGIQLTHRGWSFKEIFEK